MLPVLRLTLRWLLKVLRHNKRVFVLTFIQRSAQHSLTALSDELAKLNPRVAFAQTYPDEIQGAFDRASDALHAALMAARDNGFWVGIGIGELNIPRFAGALGAVSTTDCTGDALEFSRLAIEEAQGGAPVRCISISADNHHLAELATGSARLLYRVCADRTDAEWRVVNLLVPGVRGQQKAAATALGITTQAVSRTLVRSLWHEEQAARGALIELMTRIERTHRRAA